MKQKGQNWNLCARFALWILERKGCFSDTLFVYLFYVLLYNVNSKIILDFVTHGCLYIANEITLYNILYFCDIHNFIFYFCYVSIASKISKFQELWIRKILYREYASWIARYQAELISDFTWKLLINDLVLLLPYNHLEIIYYLTFHNWDWWIWGTICWKYWSTKDQINYNFNKNVTY